jgi:transcriptional regulator with XRE-family HTH domain
MNEISSPEELALAIGENIRTLRLQKNLSQQALATQAGVSMTALRHLESGQGANLGTLIRVVRALDKQEWLQGLAPRITINPLHMTPSHAARQRAHARRNKRAHGEKA